MCSRSEEIETEYINTRSSLIAGLWNESKANLAEFYSACFRFIKDECEKVGELFGTSSASSIVLRMIQNALETTHKSMDELLSLTSSPSSLCEAYSTSESFAQDVQNLFFPVNKPPSAGDILLLQSTVKSVLCSYESHLETYVIHEERHTASAIAIALQSVRFSLREARDRQSESFEGLFQVYSAYGDALISSCDDVFACVNEAVLRGVQFMRGLTMKPLLQCLSSLLANFVRKVSLRLMDLRLALGLTTPHNLQATPRKASEIGAESEDDASNIKAAETLARRLRSKENRVVDDRMLMPVAFQGLRFMGRLTANLGVLNGRIEPLLSSILSTLIRENTSKSQVTAISAGALFCQLLFLADAERLNELRNFLSGITIGTSAVGALMIIPSILRRLRSVAGHLAVDLSCAHSSSQLQTLHTEAVWNSAQNSFSEGTDTLPQPVVTQMGEHLLGIVQEVETFCTGTAKHDLIHTTFGGKDGNLSLFAVAGWQELRAVLGVKEEESLTGLCERSSCRAIIHAAEVSMFGNTLSSTFEEDELNDNGIMSTDSEDEAIQRYVFLLL